MSTVAKTRTEPAVKSLVVVTSPTAPTTAYRAGRLTALAFAAFLVLPLVGALLRSPEAPANENRPLNPPLPFPTKRWKLQSFPFVFDAYFADRAGLRPELLDLRRNILGDVLGDSTSDLVWIGRDGWLFMNVVGPSGLPAVQIDPGPNVRAWADALDERRRWLATRGIRYVVVVAPEKSSVYSEHLPESVRCHPPADLAALLAERCEFVDPRPALVGQKGAKQNLYYRTDSHWTDDGAFVAYCELGRALERELPGHVAKTRDRFDPTPWEWGPCDLALALGQPTRRCRETMRLYREPTATHIEPATDELQGQVEAHGNWLKHLKPRIAECASGRYRAVFLHDSFGGNLQRMMAGDFRRLASIGTYGFPVNVIEAEKPDVVIQLFVARTLAMVPPERIAP